jgi:hypothetical protein
MKTNFLSYLLIISVFAISFVSCKKDGWPCKNGSGSIQSENRSVTGFTSLDNQTEATVYVVQGTEYSVRVEAQENLLEEVRTEMKGSELQIYTEHCINKHDPINVYITMPTITGLTTSGSGYIATNSKISASSIYFTVSGSGYIQLQDSVLASSVGMTVSGSGKVDFIGEALNTTATISGSGNVTMNGQGTVLDSGAPSSFSLVISGSGSIQAFNYPIDNCHFTMSGSGSAEVYVNESLDGTLSGSGSLLYKGNPSSVSVTVTGSGVVTHVD